MKIMFEKILVFFFSYFMPGAKIMLQELTSVVVSDISLLFAFSMEMECLKDFFKQMGCWLFSYVLLSLVAS